jgi:hypothetical protein
MGLNLEAIKKKYNSVPFGIVGSFLIFLSINLLYFGLMYYYGFYNWIGDITCIFSNCGGPTGTDTFDTKQDKNKGKNFLHLSIITFIIGVLGVLIEFTKKNENKLI